MLSELNVNADGSTENAHSSPPSVSFAESDMRKLGLGARSSSPAKRSASERDEDDDATRTNTGMDMDFLGSPRSPKKSYYEHTSPMPNRFKPINEVHNGRRAVSVDMLEEDEKTDRREPLSVSGSDESGDSRPDADMFNNSIPSSPPTTEQDVGPPNASSDNPTLDEQVRIIKELLSNSVLQEGGKGFVVSNKWLSRVQSRTRQGVHEGFDKSAREGEIGPVDNSDIALNSKYCRKPKEGLMKSSG